MPEASGTMKVELRTWNSERGTMGVELWSWSYGRGTVDVDYIRGKMQFRKC